MNYLAHLLLAGPKPEHRLGALMADFVRGRPETLGQAYPEAIVEGIMCHRRVDTFTDSHPHFLASCERFSEHRRRYAGIIVDVVYDHFLSIHWDRFSAEDRDDFIASVYDMLHQYHRILPPRMQRITPLLISGDWLTGYIELDTIGKVLDRISHRLKRENSLAGSIAEVEPMLHLLEGDFLQFFPAAMDADQIRII